MTKYLHLNNKTNRHVDENLLTERFEKGIHDLVNEYLETRET
ncbi:MAG: hypothetical protein ACXADA_20065 [Candidatus Hodarchaeales archaeon]|jgi:hypothetical protein